MEGGSSGSRGKLQTEKLKAKIEEQLNRLVTQLEDLEEMKTDLDEEEYQETKQETLDQMREFQAFLEKTMAGDMTLINEFGSVQLAIQAAVSQAFQTPEVIKMFAKKQPQQLRQRLANLKRDAKLYKIPASAVTQQVVEILLALKKLGETLSPQEASFLEQNMTASLSEFEKVTSSNLGKGTQEAVLSVAGNQIKKAQT